MMLISGSTDKIIISMILTVAVLCADEALCQVEASQDKMQTQVSSTSEAAPTSKPTYQPKKQAIFRSQQEICDQNLIDAGSRPFVYKANKYCETSEASRRLISPPVLHKTEQKYVKIHPRGDSHLAMLCMGDKQIREEVEQFLTQANVERKLLPINWNWLTEQQPGPNDNLKLPARVGSVRDQGLCNTGWAHAAAGLLEGQYAPSGSTIDLSEQSLIDCSDGRLTCRSGATTYEALEQVKKIGGIVARDSYVSHSDHHHRKILFKFCKQIVKEAAPIRKIYSGNCRNALATDDELVKRFLIHYGPLATSMQVQDELRFYDNGIYTNPQCSNSTSKANHEVLIVGYGQDQFQDPPMDYWIVKNSWGQDWGQKGFFKISAGTCGIGRSITLALIKRDQYHRIE